MLVLRTRRKGRGAEATATILRPVEPDDVVERLACRAFNRYVFVPVEDTLTWDRAAADDREMYRIRVREDLQAVGLL